MPSFMENNGSSKRKQDGGDISGAIELDRIDDRSRPSGPGDFGHRADQQSSDQ